MQLGQLGTARAATLCGERIAQTGIDMNGRQLSDAPRAC